MGGKDKKAASEQGPARRGGGGKAKQFVVLALVLGLLPFGLPTLLVAAGLLPTLVFLVADRDPQKSAATAIGALNVAGVLPFLIELWEKGHTMEAAMAIIQDPMSWIVMLGSAGIGRLLIYAIPPAMASLTISRMETRLRGLREATGHLKEIWGVEVTTTTPLDQVRRQNLLS